MLLVAAAAAAVIPRCSLTGCRMLCRVLLLLQWSCAPHLPLPLQGLVFGVAVMGGTIKLFDSRNYQQGPFDAFGVSQGLMYLVGENPSKEQPAMRLNWWWLSVHGDRDVLSFLS